MGLLDWVAVWWGSLLCAVQVVNEVKDSSDARELILGSIFQADLLTQVINRRITAEHVQQRTSDETANSEFCEWVCVCVCAFVWST